MVSVRTLSLQCAILTLVLVWPEKPFITRRTFYNVQPDQPRPAWIRDRPMSRPTQAAMIRNRSSIAGPLKFYEFPDGRPVYQLSLAVCSTMRP
eukprot:g78688.t1